MAIAGSELRKQRADEVLRHWLLPLSMCLPLFVTLAAYFLWVFHRGAFGMRGRPGFGNLAFAMYEFGGFQGLGPPRNVLRTEGGTHFAGYWPLIGIGIVAWLTVSVYLVRLCRDRSRQTKASMLAAFAATMILFFVSAAAVNFHFWGRHLAACFPLLVFALLQTVGKRQPPGRGKRMESMAFILLAAAWIISDFRLVSLPEYAKDDYRAAVNLALDEANRSHGTVVWVADELCGRYYGLDFENGMEDRPWRVLGRAVLAENWPPPRLAGWLKNATYKTPIIVVLSKPDTYDSYGTWTAAVRSLKARPLGSVNTFNLYVYNVPARVDH